MRLILAESYDNEGFRSPSITLLQNVLKAGNPMELDNQCFKALNVVLDDIRNGNPDER